jgi:hypothetical protein
MTAPTKRRKAKRRSRSVTKQGDTTEFKYRSRSLAAALGGFENLNPGQRWLVRAATQIGLELEEMQRRRANNEEIDLTQLGMMTDRLGRVPQRLGLEPESAKQDAGIAFIVMQSEPEPVDVTPEPIIDAPIEQLPAPERATAPESLASPPPEQAPPRPLTSDERMARHDQERAKAKARPASPRTFVELDNGGFGRTEVIRDWSDRRR